MSSLNASTESLGGTSSPPCSLGLNLSCSENILCDPSPRLIQVPVEHRCSVGCGSQLQIGLLKHFCNPNFL